MCCYTCHKGVSLGIQKEIISRTIKDKDNEKFNARLGRMVTYNFYPVKKFVIEKINPNGTLDLAIGTWKVLHVKVEDVCRKVNK